MNLIPWGSLLYKEALQDPCYHAFSTSGNHCFIKRRPCRTTVTMNSVPWGITLYKEAAVCSSLCIELVLLYLVMTSVKGCPWLSSSDLANQWNSFFYLKQNGEPVWGASLTSFNYTPDVCTPFMELLWQSDLSYHTSLYPVKPIINT